MHRAIGIDPGTLAGWASFNDGLVQAGTFRNAIKADEGRGMRYVKFEQSLGALMDVVRPECVFYEDVHRHLGTTAAHVYGGLMAVLLMQCEKRGVPCKGLSVQAVKKHGTGKGNADKAMMVAAARAKWPDIALETPDVADALWILDLGLSQFS